MPGYSACVTDFSESERSTTLPLCASSGSEDGSCPITTFGAVLLLSADTSLAVRLSELAMYWPLTLTSLCVWLKCETR